MQIVFLFPLLLVSRAGFFVLTPPPFSPERLCDLFPLHELNNSLTLGKAGLGIGVSPEPSSLLVVETHTYIDRPIPGHSQSSLPSLGTSVLKRSLISRPCLHMNHL
jgi:hypothetical protein